MSTTQNLKFIHLSTGSASAHKADTGAIIFEKATGRIAVATGANTDVEYYGGGRIADATFDTVGKVLTLSFNDGSDAIKLDFSDTASATGVNAIMKAHADRIKALEDKVGKAAENDTPASGLFKAVADNASDIAKINNPTTGILAQAKKDTDSKLNTLKGGYTGTLQQLRTDIDSNDTDITALKALHADKDASSKKTVKEEIDAKVGDIKVDTVKEYIDTAVNGVNGDVTALTGRVTTLEGTVSDHGTKLTTLIGADANKSVRAIANEELAAQLIPEGAKESLDTLQEIAAWIQKHPDDASAMNTAIENLQTSVGKSTDEAKADGSVYARIAKNAADIKTNADAITSNDNDIAALQRLHADKDGVKISVADEVKAGIKGLGTDSKTGTGSGVSVTVTTTEGKVSSVAVDASTLANKVDALENTVGDDSKGLVKAVADNAANIADNLSKINANTGKIDGHTTRIGALEELHAKDGQTRKTVKQEVTDGIAGIAEASKSNTAGSDVVVTVKTKSGSVSGVTVDASVLKKAVTDETTRATGIENKLRTDLGTKADGEGDAFTRIKALEKNQADGALMWSVWE